MNTSERWWNYGKRDCKCDHDLSKERMETPFIHKRSLDRGKRVNLLLSLEENDVHAMHFASSTTDQSLEPLRAALLDFDDQIIDMKTRIVFMKKKISQNEKTNAARLLDIIRKTK